MADTVTETLDKTTLLAIQSACNEAGIQLPWARIAEMLGRNITQGAIIQHLAKIRTRMVQEGLEVPPPLKRGGKGYLPAHSVPLPVSSKVHAGNLKKPYANKRKRANADESDSDVFSTPRKTRFRSQKKMPIKKEDPDGEYHDGANSPTKEIFELDEELSGEGLQPVEPMATHGKVARGSTYLVLDMNHGANEHKTNSDTDASSASSRGSEPINIPRNNSKILTLDYTLRPKLREFLDKDSHQIPTQVMGNGPNCLLPYGTIPGEPSYMSFARPNEYQSLPDIGTSFLNSASPANLGSEDGGGYSGDNAGPWTPQPTPHVAIASQPITGHDTR